MEYNLRKSIGPPTEEGSRRSEIHLQIYKQLEHRQTRILNLHPGDGDEAVECDLLDVELSVDDGVTVISSGLLLQYEAVSYAWGEPVLDGVVMCNGLPILVTTECANVLQHLRYSHRERCLWIDFICINQRDDEDKSRQVRNMFTIFRKATRVIGWMGIPTSNESLFLEASSDKPCLPHLPDLGSGDTSRHRLLLSQGLGEILKRPWFSRLWVRQEVFAARKLSMAFGSSLMTFDKLKRHINFHTEGEYKLQDPENHLDSVDLINRYGNGEFRDENGGNAQTDSGAVGTPLRLFISSRSLKWSDPRDIAYGALGILSAGEYTGQEILPWTRFPIDYRKTLSQVYQDISLFFVETNPFGALPVLYESRASRDLTLPSWVTDWRQRIPRFCKIYDSGSLPKSMKRVIGNPDITHLPYPGVLRVKGYEIGTIKSPHPVPTESPQGTILWAAPCESFWSQSPFTQEKVHFPEDLLAECQYNCALFTTPYPVIFENVRKSSSSVHPHECDFVFDGDSHKHGEDDFVVRIIDQNGGTSDSAYNCILVSEVCREGDRLILTDLREDPFVIRQVHEASPQRYVFLGPTRMAHRPQLWTLQYLALYARNGQRPPSIGSNVDCNHKSEYEIRQEWRTYELI